MFVADKGSIPYASSIERIDSAFRRIRELRYRPFAIEKLVAFGCAPLALVVDDDPFTLMNASDIVAEAGFKPLEATNLAAAIAVLEQHWAEMRVLFTDVQMPGGRDGFSLAWEAAHRWPTICIIVASGRARPGPDDLPDRATFIGKPFSAQIVHDRLRMVLPDEHQPRQLRR